MQSKSGQSAKGLGKQQVLENSGLEDVQYLIAEHRDVNGAPANHLDLQFSGTRQRIASWLASPAPIGSLDFVSHECGVCRGRAHKRSGGDCRRFDGDGFRGKRRRRQLELD